MKLVGYRAQTTFTRVVGIGSSYMDVNQLYPQQGRFFSPSDNERRRLVCLVGEDVVENLELPGGGVGEFIRIGNEWCKIVGVMEARGEIFGFSQDDYVLLPFNTMQRILGASREYDIQIQMLVDDMSRIEEVTDMGQQTRAVVQFNARGRKTLILQYARLEVVS